ncbi:hypothetical protein H4O14_08365 [Bacillus sp. PAMC26568]|nr:hypothetical protein H4O14_08365 [Bacillus sp. PAMC26568]
MLPSIELPKDFRYEPFFSEKVQCVSDLSGNSIEEVLRNNPFFYDICAKANIDMAISPWTNSALYVPLLLKEWDAVQLKIINQFQAKARKADKADMNHGISILICLLNWSNDRPVDHLDVMHSDMGSLQIKPINAAERLTYLISKPEQYHSFVQLQQLIEETLKQFYKKNAMTNKNKL